MHVSFGSKQHETNHALNSFPCEGTWPHLSTLSVGPKADQSVFSVIDDSLPSFAKIVLLPPCLEFGLPSPSAPRQITNPNGQQNQSYICVVVVVVFV